MPAALEVDHEQVRIVALAVGPSEAARQFGLPIDTVAQWSSREGWFKTQRDNELAQQQAIQIKRASQGLSESVSLSASDILKEFGTKTRLGMARSVQKAVESAEELSGNELFDSANNLKALAGTAAIVHSWSAGNSGPTMRLDLLAGTLDVRSGSAPDPDFDQIEIPD